MIAILWPGVDYDPKKVARRKSLKRGSLIPMGMSSLTDALGIGDNMVANEKEDQLLSMFE